MTRAPIGFLVFMAIAGLAAAAVAQPAAKAPDRTIRLSGPAPVAAYGYDSKNPILLGGMAENDFDKRVEAYVGLLSTPEGEPLKVLLNETCCPHRPPGAAQPLSLQMIEAGADGRRPYGLYVNGFEAGPLHAPKGLLAARSEENAEIIQGALDNLRAGFPDGAVQSLRPLAEAGDVMAQYQLGRIAADRRDFPAAYGWFLMAARNGHSVSQAAVSAMLEEGKGVAADRVAAKRWRERAAANGHPGSLMALALEALSGKPDAAAVSRAAAMLQRAADLGDPAAQAAYGLMLVQGRGVARDSFQGLVWLKLAAKAGDANAVAAWGRLVAGHTAQTVARVDQAADQWSKRDAPVPVAADNPR
ncbi:MAG: tetratricopeptide repeat protein [Sphingomonadales bacterium]